MVVQMHRRAVEFFSNTYLLLNCFVVMSDMA
jgi:hypothetical protein